MWICQYKTRFRLISFVLLTSIVLTGCSQSIPRHGESIDSVSAGAGTAERIIEENSVPEDEHGPASEGQTNQEAAQDQHASEQGNPAMEPQATEGSLEAADHQKSVADANDGGERNAGSENQAAVQTADAANQAQPQDSAENENESQASTASQPMADSNESSAAANEPPQAAPTDKPSDDEQVQPEWDGDNKLTFAELYASVGVRGIVLSDKVEALTGKEVEMSGYMAPPLTAGVRFFVLTKTLMAVCPFCSTDADWPTDIVVVYLPDGEELNPTEHPVKVTGTLDTGSFRDEDTGFVSLVRIYADKVEVLK